MRRSVEGQPDHLGRAHVREEREVRDRDRGAENERPGTDRVVELRIELAEIRRGRFAQPSRGLVGAPQHRPHPQRHVVNDGVEDRVREALPLPRFHPGAGLGRQEGRLRVLIFEVGQDVGRASDGELAVDQHRHLDAGVYARKPRPLVVRQGVDRLEGEPLGAEREAHLARERAERIVEEQHETSCRER